MSSEQKRDGEQAKIWNGTSGNAWVDEQELIDRLLQPFADLLIEALLAKRGDLVLDVGCGTGATTLAAARLVGVEGRCVGVDISETMLTLARRRAELEHSSATFICADAQTHAFEPASFDAIISRFGVMFFNDSVRAFANLHRAAKRGAQLRLLTWRGPTENPFMMVAERAAAPFLPSIPPRRPDEPGQFAFADQNRVRRILDESGWTDIEVQPVDVPCSFPEKDLTRYFTRFGALGRALPDADEKARAHIVELTRAAFDPYVHGSEVRFTGASWMVNATSP
jgi:ubiquinone/menaquinone biosynthesis C-methylase UbiE